MRISIISRWPSIKIESGIAKFMTGLGLKPSVKQIGIFAL